jgi:Fic/DOC family protein
MSTHNTQNTIHNGLLAKLLTEARAAAIGHVIKSSALERQTRERLTAAGYLSEIMRGWYLLTTPAGVGTSTLWYSNYFDFVREYLTERFGQDYCLTAESSLDLISGQNIISRQVTIITKRPSNQVIQLPHHTSLMLYQDAKNFPEQMGQENGLNYIPLHEAICKAQPTYFLNNPLNMEICFKLVGSPAEISRVLLVGQQIAAANRVVGAYKELGDIHSASQIEKDMLAAGIQLNPINPFQGHKLFLSGKGKITSPYAGRISAMWEKMREDILEVFPAERGLPDPGAIKIIEQIYKHDSYHSLSIEGYKVTPELIERIERGEWDPDSHTTDSQQRDALAAKGYHGAFQSVMASVLRVLKGQSPGKVFYEDIQNWYRELFKPVVQSGLLSVDALAGYRSQQVYISGSRHVPPPHGAVLDAMSALEEKLTNETSAAVRAILGHFIFVFIHPYMDGNGRIGRFIMNLMLVSGGYNWTVIRTSERSRYMSALETASVEGNIKPFAEFVLSEMAYWQDQMSKMKPANDSK